LFDERANAQVSFPSSAYEVFCDSMSVQEIESAIHRLTRTEAEQLGVWLDEYLEDQMELADGVKKTLDQSRREIAESEFTTRQPD
jgi:hypothetical protein